MHLDNASDKISEGDTDRQGPCCMLENIKKSHVVCDACKKLHSPKLSEMRNR